MKQVRTERLTRRSNGKRETTSCVSSLLPMSEARKDGTPVLLFLKDPIPYDAGHVACWAGLAFVGMHDPLASDGFDVGWMFAAPVGQGGFPDDWFEGWLPLPVVVRS